MQLTRGEQETVILFDNDSDEARIYTASPQMMKKLEMLRKNYPDCYRMIEQTDYSMTFVCPKNLITLRKPRMETAEDRARKSRRMREFNLNKKSDSASRV
ncbi:MAG: hypothetical protein LUD18_10850 [Lachnospiraceae bacterium]|nr:hypothetical protein [Lachnospiraceae bacterium]